MKKGFTLIELLAVVALIAVLAVFLVPNVLKIFTENKNQLSSIQKQQVESAVNMYISDYCINPISSCYSCPFQTTYDDIKGELYISENITISLDSLSNVENDCSETDQYIDSSISNNCNGDIKISNGKVILDEIQCDFNK